MLGASIAVKKFLERDGHELITAPRVFFYSNPVAHVVLHFREFSQGPRTLEFVGLFCTSGGTRLVARRGFFGRVLLDRGE